MKKILLPLILFLLFISKSNAQVPHWMWAHGIGSLNDDVGKSITIGNDGYIYITGFFKGSVDFNPGSGTNYLTSGTDNNIFIAKYDTLGNYIWAENISGSSGSSSEGKSIMVDDSGYIYLMGFFDGTIDFNPGIGTYNLTALNQSGNLSVFISKYDSSGGFIWANRIDGPQGSVEGYSMSLDSNKNIYVTGSFSGTIDFDPGIPTYNLTGTQGGWNFDIFIFKLNSQGNFIWAKKIGNIGPDRGESIKVDKNKNVYLTGYFSSLVDFNPDTLLVFNMQADGAGTSIFDVFVLKLDSGGNFIWAKRMGGDEDDEGFSIAVDDSANVYTTGFYTSYLADFNPDSLQVYYLYHTMVNSANLFISKLDSLGNFKWAKSMNGFGTSWGTSIEIDANDNLYCSGFFSSICDFDPDSINTYFSNANQLNNVFVVKLNSDGSFFCEKDGGSIEPYLYSSMAVSKSGKVYLIGSFYTNSTSFGDITLVNSNTSGNSKDIFVSELAMCSDFANLDIDGCGSYISPSGNTVWINSGYYFDTIPDSWGNDSVITINLSIFPIDTSLTQIGSTLSSNAAAATYQWLYCDTGFAIINGATNQIFTATANGNYAVAVTQNGCTDTSVCYSVTGVGINKPENSETGFQIYPNPANEQFTVISKQQAEYKITITNMLGEIIYEQAANHNSQIINLKLFSQGIYLVQLQSADLIKIKKLIVVK